MSEFDNKAAEWDKNPMHWERSEAIAKAFLKMVPVTKNMKALEYGAGTGILSFLLSDYFSEITLMDNSKEMVRMMKEKVENHKKRHFNPLYFDLEHADYTEKKFDCILLQMVLHHVAEPYELLTKFFNLLNPGGCLAIADLYPEDSSFHGSEVQVHHGFDPEKLKEKLSLKGFKNIQYDRCYEVVKEENRKFPVFLMIAFK